MRSIFALMRVSSSSKQGVWASCRVVIPRILTTRETFNYSLDLGISYERPQLQALSQYHFFNDGLLARQPAGIPCGFRCSGCSDVRIIDGDVFFPGATTIPEHHDDVKAGMLAFGEFTV